MARVTARNNSAYIAPARSTWASTSAARHLSVRPSVVGSVSAVSTVALVVTMIGHHTRAPAQHDRPARAASAGPSTGARRRAVGGPGQSRTRRSGPRYPARSAAGMIVDASWSSTRSPMLCPAGSRPVRPWPRSRHRPTERERGDGRREHRPSRARVHETGELAADDGSGDPHADGQAGLPVGRVDRGNGRPLSPVSAPPRDVRTPACCRAGRSRRARVRAGGGRADSRQPRPQRHGHQARRAEARSRGLLRHRRHLKPGRGGPNRA